MGVAGGIPHYTDYKRHVRLGDVIIATADQNRQQLTNGHGIGEKPYCYIYSSSGESKIYYPVNSSLQEIAKQLQAQPDGKKVWEEYLQDGLAHLEKRVDNDYTRPPPNTDKLYMNIGNRDVIEVQHPSSQDDIDGER